MVAAAGVRATQAAIVAAGAFPASSVRATMANVTALIDANGDQERVTQALVVVAALGRTTNPRVLAWTFTLDEHTHYVIRLGTQKTLELDTKTGMWAIWGSSDGPLWRAFTGINWQGAGTLRGLGSNVVVGDDGNGSLYILDQDAETDDDAIVGSDTQRPFTRKVTGQLAFRGRASVPVSKVELLGSVGQQASDSLTGVTLYTSDDGGQLYTDRGTIDVQPGDYGKRLDWRSLGSMRAPGRLFRIEDDGALKRIDSLSKTP